MEVLRKRDIVIIGGGIMGLLSAYKLSQSGSSITIIDAGKIAGLQAASSGITRSIRNDYPDQVMSAMAYDAFKSWPLLEEELGVKLTVNCGCLSFINTTVSDLPIEQSYAWAATGWLERDGRRYKVLSNQAEFANAYPQLRADYGVLDIEAGVGLPKTTLDNLLSRLKTDDKVQILEDTQVKSIKGSPNNVLIRSSAGKLSANTVIVAAGLGTAEVCKKVEGVNTDMQITANRPFELKYFFTDDDAYKSNRLPAAAFLDIGIYLHPIFDSLTPGVKVGYYSPPGSSVVVDDSLSFIDKFVDACLPGLRQVHNNRLITEVDQCSYDMTPDNKFILGYLGNQQNIIVAGGFNGTGFKFAPTIANIVTRLVHHEEPGYDINQFNPNRFNKEQEL